MKRFLLLPLLAVLFISFQSCEKDEPGNTPDAPGQETPTLPSSTEMNVTIYSDGSTSTGVPFKWIPETNNTEFYLNCLKYRIVDDHVELIGADDYELIKTLNGIAKPYQTIKIDGIFYSLTLVAQDAFRNNNSLKSIYLPEGVTKIGQASFYKCTNLTNIDIPITLNEIESYAFCYCENLKTISLPPTLSFIGDFSFAVCSKLENIKIPNTIKNIYDGTFYYCESLTKIDLPKSIYGIGAEAFQGCHNLSEISLPTSLTSIGQQAFCYCTNLKNISLPPSISDLGLFVFARCSNLESIDIPENITTLNDGLFLDCTNLQTINLPSSLKIIRSQVFKGCTSLKNLEIPYSVNYIDWYNTFKDCISLKTLSIMSDLPAAYSESFDTFDGVHLDNLYMGKGLLDQAHCLASYNVSLICLADNIHIPWKDKYFDKPYTWEDFYENNKSFFEEHFHCTNIIKMTPPDGVPDVTIYL